MHCNLGIDAINRIKLENPHLMTPEFREEALMHKGVEPEHRCAEDHVPHGMLGLNSAQFKKYLHYIASRCCQQTGAHTLFPGASNPFPWMAEMIVVMKKEKNFFMTRAIEYRMGVR